ncbi:MAG: peptidylprolyl isomerase [Acetobacteraceae bacterium]|nr:peptidylprolyl isomerase [Acetobacteraceae bacterium]
MRRRILIVRAFIASAISIVTGAVSGAKAQAPAADPENTIYLDVKSGRVVIQLLPELAPGHVERIKSLARQGFYDNTPFHRVIEGFMAQGGDPTGTGTGGSKLPNLKAEFTTQRQFLRGVCGMARTGDPNSANSQWFIMFAPNASLNGQYTIWGQVVKGMEFVDQIKRGDGNNGMVSNPDRVVRMRVATDVK